jgi:hypothetical protein
MRIDSSGNVGIGTSSPGYLLHLYKNGVGGSAPNQPVLFIQHSDVNAIGTGGSNGGQIQFYNQQQNNTGWAANTIWGRIDFYGSQPSSGNAQLGASILAAGDGNTGQTLATHLSFYTSDNSNGGNNVERLRIDSSGNTQLTSASASILNSSGRPMVKQTGGILAVYQATNATTYTISGSGTFTGMSITLTPSSSSSRFMLIANLGQIAQSSGGSTIALNFARSGTNLNYISGGTYNGIGAFVNADSNAGLTSPPTIIYVDSPATASSITYTVIYSCDGTKLVGKRGDTFIAASQQFQILEIAG